MKPENICLAFRFRNEDERSIRRYVENNFKYCDCFVAIDDRSDSCPVRLDNHPKCAAYVRKNSQTDMFDNLDKEVLYSLAKSTNKTHILVLDIDEIMDMSFEQEIETIPEDVDCVRFNYYTMYPDEFHFITDYPYAFPRRSQCLAKFLDFAYFDNDVSHRLHCGRIPKYIRDGKHKYGSYVASSPLYHFSMCSAEKRKARHDFYMKYDGNGKIQRDGYDHIIKEHSYQEISPNIIWPAS